MQLRKFHISSATRLDLFIAAAIFVFGIVLRITGISGSLPYVGHPDEPKVIDSAIHIVKTGDLNPHLYIWPSLYIYLQALLLKAHVLIGTLRGYYSGAASLPDVTHIFTTDTGIYLWARTLAAVIGALACVLLYYTGKAMFNSSRRVGVVAALMLAVSPLHVQYSHFALTDVPMSTVGIAVLWASYNLSRTSVSNLVTSVPQARIIGRPALGNPLLWVAALCGLLVGVAAGTKYNGLYLGFVPIVAWVIAWRRNARAKERPSRGQLVAALLTIPAFAVLGFVLCEPFALLDWPGFWQGFNFQVQAYLPAHNLGEMWTSLTLQLQELGDSDAFFFAPALLGAAVLVINPPARNRAPLLILFPIFYLLAMSRFTFTAARNLLVILPFFAILTGYAIDLASTQATGVVRGYAGRVQNRTVWAAVRWAAVGLVLLMMLLDPLRVSRNYSASMADPDSRNLAWSWAQAQMRQGYRVAAELHPYQTQEWPDVPAFDVENPGNQQSATAQPPDWYKARGYDYVVLNSNLKDADRDPALLKQYRALRVVKTFPGDKEGGKGPSVTVLSVGQGTNQPIEQGSENVAGKPKFEDYATLVRADIAPVTSTDMLLDPANIRQQGTFRPGQVVGLNLYYRALRDGKPADRAWQVWVHLVDPKSGATVSQVDVQPLSGLLRQWPALTHELHPVTSWHEGEWVVGSYNFALPAGILPGKYRLDTGMWLPPNGPGARVTYDAGTGTPADHVTLGEIDIR